MKKLISLIVLLFSVNQLYAQDLYPIFKEAFKHVNIYKYHSYKNPDEYIDTSIILKKGTKERYKKISNILLSSGFKFNNFNDTILISTQYLNYEEEINKLPSKILARSSRSIKILSRTYQYRKKYMETKLLEEESNIWGGYPYSSNVYAFKIFLKDIDDKKYTENYFKTVLPTNPEAYEKYYRQHGGKDLKNIYYMMYKGNTTALKKIHLRNNNYENSNDEVLRIEIKDGKIVSPTLNWNY